MSNQSYKYMNQKGDLLYLEIAKKVITQVNFTRCGRAFRRFSTPKSTNYSLT